MHIAMYTERMSECNDNVIWAQNDILALNTGSKFDAIFIERKIISIIDHWLEIGNGLSGKYFLQSNVGKMNILIFVVLIVQNTMNTSV